MRWSILSQRLGFIELSVLKDIAPYAAVVAASITAGFGLYWNFRSAKSARKLPFLTKQLEYCFEASELAAKLARSDDEAEWLVAQKRFFQLFFGPLAIVEDDDVARSMMRFALALESEGGGFPPNHRLNGPSLDLSGEIRKLLLRSWQIKDLNKVLNTDG
jgi:hypothetical protein